MNEEIEQKLAQERANGQYATELLNNPVFQDIWTQYEQKILTEIKNSSPRDAEGREAAVLLLQMLGVLKAMIMQTAQTGKLAQIQLERQQTVMGRAMEWIGRDGLRV